MNPKTRIERFRNAESPSPRRGRERERARSHGRLFFLRDVRRVTLLSDSTGGTCARGQGRVPGVAWTQGPSAIAILGRVALRGSLQNGGRNGDLSAAMFSFSYSLYIRVRHIYMYIYMIQSKSPNQRAPWVICDMIRATL